MEIFIEKKTARNLLFVGMVIGFIQCSNQEFAGSSGKKSNEPSESSSDGKNSSQTDSKADSNGVNTGDGSASTGGGGLEVEGSGSVSKRPKLELDGVECREPEWSRGFGTNTDIDGVGCREGEYFGGVGYRAYTGGADGVGMNYCCKIKPAIVLENTECKWTGFMTQGEEQSCDVGSYLSRIDYRSEVVPRDGGYGALRFQCCVAFKDDPIEKKNCTWSDWFAGEAGNGVEECPVGSYVTGLGYTQNADGKLGGRMKVECCQP